MESESFEEEPAVRAKRRGIEVRKDLIEQYRQSGLTRGAFSRQHGVSYSMFCRWLRSGGQSGKSVRSEQPVLRAIEVISSKSEEAVAVEWIGVNGERWRIGRDCPEPMWRAILGLRN